MTVLSILAVLFLALIILVPLMERLGNPMKEEEVNKISRWIIPLIALLLVLKLITYWFV